VFWSEWSRWEPLFGCWQEHLRKSSAECRSRTWSSW